MTKTQQETQYIRDLLYPIIGKTTTTTYFSYYGIFKDQLMFGLCKEQQFYLKLNPQDVSTVLSYPGVQRLMDENIPSANKYYLIPISLLNQLHNHKSWLNNSLDYIEANKRDSYYTKKSQIRSLPNMTYQLERKLRKINIYSVEQLIQVGEINAFVALIKIGEDISHITLFKLHGAIHHQLVYTIPANVQKRLLYEADNALYAAGLRKRFKKQY